MAALPAALKRRVEDLLASGAADAEAVVMGDGYAIVVQRDGVVSVAFYGGERPYDDRGEPDEALFLARRHQQPPGAQRRTSGVRAAERRTP